MSFMFEKLVVYQKAVDFALRFELPAPPSFVGQVGWQAILEGAKGMFFPRLGRRRVACTQDESPVQRQAV